MGSVWKAFCRIRSCSVLVRVRFFFGASSLLIWFSNISMVEWTNLTSEEDAEEKEEEEELDDWLYMIFGLCEDGIIGW